MSTLSQSYRNKQRKCRNPRPVGQQESVRHKAFPISGQARGEVDKGKMSGGEWLGTGHKPKKVLPGV